MKKFGFTLAEILIALSIVGVISAITIPTMVVENQKKIWSSSLATAVSNLENAMTTYIITEGKTSLTEIDVFKNGTSKEFGEDFAKKRMKLKYNEDNIFYLYGSNKIKYLPPKLDTSYPDVKQYVLTYIANFNGPVWESKNGFFYVFADRNKYNDIVPDPNNSLKLTKIAAFVLIDINGKDKPNRLGRDVFFYLLGDDGCLFPLGGDDYKKYVEARGVGNTPFKPEDCSVSATDGFLPGATCSAVLNQNGFKMNY